MSAGIDKERVAFEADVRDRFSCGEHTFARMPDGRYYNYANSKTYGGRAQSEFAPVSMLWEVWQARAAIPPSTGVAAGQAADSARLDWLEQRGNDGGLLLHAGNQDTGRRSGLGLVNTGRTLRQAVDSARGVKAAAHATPQTAPSQAKNAALQALVDQAQELDMGYEKAVECAICDGTGTAFGKVCDCRGAATDSGAVP